MSMIAGVFGCGGTVLVDDEEEGGEEEPAGPLADAGAEEDAGPQEDAAVPGDGSVADAGTTCGNPTEDWEAYRACCDQVNWDWEAGCEAWGPPVPPEMGVA
ncbi:hypothetical protein [Chondromyces apiculatus]|uniref:hypothetical protein n=1 Tax=Chondromyces apiculatus TaxID=51 RepID=UPI0005C4FB0B|nr:hypothetical protein [Chondromyces apiculatus]